jgi:hypothetical protein
LVVIAIIALLMAILMPSLRAAKQQAASANCMASCRSLSMAWVMYAEENDSAIAPANMGPDAWIGQPQSENGTRYTPTQTSPVVTDEDEFRGVREGLLYRYVKDEGVCHCPADNMRISKYDGTRVFGSYALANCLNGEPAAFKHQIKNKNHYCRYVSQQEMFPAAGMNDSVDKYRRVVSGSAKSWTGED